MLALKRFPLFAASSSSSIISVKSITTLRVSLPLNISPNSLLPQGTLFSPWSVVQFRGAKVLCGDAEPGDVIQRKGRIYEVVKAKNLQNGKGGAKIQLELREVGTGNKISEKFPTDDAFESVFLEDKSFTFLYTDGDSVVLMEPTTFEQTDVSKDLFGKSVVYLKDEMTVNLQFYDGNPLSASVPPCVTCTVTEENPDKEGLTATPQYKKVLLENGLTVKVPLSIEAGDEITINTTNDSYMTRFLIDGGLLQDMVIGVLAYKSMYFVETVYIRSTAGEMLAKTMKFSYLDADDFHPRANIEKMSKGIPLSEEDRITWLERLHDNLGKSMCSGKTVILGCSALQKRYREILRTADSDYESGDGRVKFVYLEAPMEVIAARVERRAAEGKHFMPATLLKSQMDLF